MISTKICPAGTHCPPGTVQKPDLVTHACIKGHYCLRGDEVSLGNSVKPYWIIIRFLETAHLPLPQANINTYFSLRAKCWCRGGVGGRSQKRITWDLFSDSTYHMETGGRIMTTFQVEPPPYLWLVTVAYSCETILDTMAPSYYTKLLRTNVHSVGARVTAKRHLFTECPYIHYWFLEQNAYPIKCPNGTFNPHTGRKHVSECIKCTQGYYCEPEGLEKEVRGKGWRQNAANS